MSNSDLAPLSTSTLMLRGGLGGLLMGLANLVPGISGGTMLLASGVYPQFIDAVASLSRLRFSKRAVLTLGVVGGAACISILLGAGAIKELVLEHRWVMYSLFIGLTLGGAPMVARLIGRPSVQAGFGAGLGFFGMAALAVAQGAGVGPASSGEAGMLALFLGGIAGASAMILPGVSGSYLLLVLGLYVPILGGIDSLKHALKAMDVAALMPPLIGVVLPVGFGVVIGVALVSNVLKVLIAKLPDLTHGALLGLLLGAVIGLFPFQEGVAPQAGEVIKGRELTAESALEVELDDWPVKVFTPAPMQVLGSLGLILVGMAATTAVGWAGRDKPDAAAAVTDA